MNKTLKNKRRKVRQPKSRIRLFGDPILKVVCEPVEASESVSEIIRDMMYILFNNKNGVGLAANQIGYTKRVIIVKEFGYWQVLINPVVTEERGETIETEGCLSYPNVYKEIKRVGNVKVQYENDQRLFRAPIWFSIKASRIVQHEIDHLNGMCKVGME